MKDRDNLDGLPGNASVPSTAAMIRVNHAGEYGAKRIYEGQLAVLGQLAIGPTLRHMAEQEQRHLDTFEQLLVERRVRPTVLQPLWHAAGFAMGAVTALLGQKAAMACTVAVEEVIEAHYERQLAHIPTTDSALRAYVSQFQQEEREHRDIGLKHDAEQTPAYHLLSRLIKTASRTAIWLSERF